MIVIFVKKNKKKSMKKCIFISIFVLIVMLLVDYFLLPLPLWVFFVGGAFSFFVYFCILAIGLFMVFKEMRNASTEVKEKIKELIEKGGKK